MIEVPVNDGWHWHLVKRRRLDTEAFCDKPIAPGGPYDIARLAAIARDAASAAKLLQRNPGPVVSKDDRQRCSAAFDRLHLQNGGCASRAPSPKQGTATGSTACPRARTAIHRCP